MEGGRPIPAGLYALGVSGHLSSSSNGYAGSDEAAVLEPAIMSQRSATSPMANRSLLFRKVEAT